VLPFARSQKASWTTSQSPPANPPALLFSVLFTTLGYRLDKSSQRFWFYPAGYLREPPTTISRARAIIMLGEIEDTDISVGPPAGADNQTHELCCRM
jgi:hypothetical protein